jgi:hypothetical protein
MRPLFILKEQQIVHRSGRSALRIHILVRIVLWRAKGREHPQRSLPYRAIRTHDCTDEEYHRYYTQEPAYR